MSNLGNKDVFANNLKKYMQLNGKSRTEVCQALGFKYSTFADWINGKKYPRMDKIEMLANYFGIPSAFEIAVTVDTFGSVAFVLKTRTTITGTSRDCMMRSQRFMRRHPARWRGVSETPYPCAGCRRRTRPLIIFSLT